MIWTTYRCPKCKAFRRAREGRPAPVCHGVTVLHQKPPRSSFARKPPEQEPSMTMRIPRATAEAATQLHGRSVADSVRLAAADGVHLGERVLALETAVDQLREAVRDLERTRRQQRAEVSR